MRDLMWVTKYIFYYVYHHVCAFRHTLDLVKSRHHCFSLEVLNAQRPANIEIESDHPVKKTMSQIIVDQSILGSVKGKVAVLAGKSLMAFSRPSTGHEIYHSTL